MSRPGMSRPGMKLSGMKLPSRIAAAFRVQAEACEGLGSPFTAAVCRALVRRLDGATAFGRRIAGWKGDPVADALALRACGALHHAVRTGRAPALAAVYPPAGAGTGLAEARGDVLDGTIRELDGELAAFLDSPPQTNEVARSGVLLGGHLTIAAETGLPVVLCEIGSSAGLNLHPDCYRYDLGAAGRWGRAEAPVTIATDWRGTPPPLDAPLRIVARAGCDAAPVDPGDPAARARMLAYIWPDQGDRLARAAAALAHAAAHPAPVKKADAAGWVEATLAQPAAPGAVRVLAHSITWQYLPEAGRRRIAAALEAAGAAATAEAPLAWLRLEPDAVKGSAAVQLTLWPGGVTRLLGRGDYHGRWAEWSAD